MSNLIGAAAQEESALLAKVQAFGIDIALEDAEANGVTISPRAKEHGRLPPCLPRGDAPHEAGAEYCRWGGLSRVSLSARVVVKPALLRWNRSTVGGAR